MFSRQNESFSFPLGKSEEQEINDRDEISVGHI